MSDRLIDLEKKINMIRDSLEGAIQSLETRVRMLMKTLHSAEVEPVETHGFVWAMRQLRNGLPVKCLADGVIYVRCNGDDRWYTCQTHIEFSSKVVNSSWTLAPGYEPSKPYNPLLSTGSFDWAMWQLKDGKRVRRRDWPVGQHWKLNDTMPFCLNYDIDADDWEIFYESHDIHWAVQQLQNDKIVKRRCWKTFRLYPHDAIRLEVEDITADDWELAEDD